MQNKKTIEESAIFVDVQGTLVKTRNVLDHSLYTNMQKVKQHGAKVIIFTMASPKNMIQQLHALGVDTKTFPVVNKSAYRGHLFTGLIVDDVAPHLQGFLAAPHTYDSDGKILSYIAKQLTISPQLTFDKALQNYRTMQKQQHHINQTL